MNTNHDEVHEHWKSSIPWPLHPWLSLWQEAVIALIVAAATFALGAMFDLHERVHAWLGPHDALELDELWLTAGVAVVTAAVLSVLRWRQVRRILQEQRRLVDSLREREKESEAQRRMLRTVLDASLDIIIFRDRDLKYRLFNRALCDFLGRSEEDIFGKTDAELYSKEYFQRSAAEDRLVMERGETIVVERESLGAYGPNLFEVTKTPVRDGQGEVIGVLLLVHDITERKRVEAALAEERNLLRTLIDTLPDYIYVKDLEGRYLLVNQGMANKQNASAPERLIGASSYEIHPPDLAEQYREHDRLVIKSGQAVEREMPVQYASGERRTHLIVKAPLRDSAGNIVGIVGGDRDISDRKRAEAERDEQRRLLRAVLDASPALIALRDRELKYRLVNRALCEFLGRSEADILGKDCTAFHPAAHCQQIEAENRWVFEHNEVLTVEREMPSPRGRRWFEASKNPVRDESGDVIGVLTLSHDITERKRVEAALAEERNLLRTLIDTLPDHIFMKDTASRLLMVNRTLARDLGFSGPKDLIGLTDFDLNPRDVAERYCKNDRLIIESGQPLEDIEVLKMPDGEQRTYSVTLVPLRDATDRVTGLVGIGRDVTEQLRIMSDLRESEERYRLLAETAGDVIATFDLEGWITYMNQAGLYLSGYTEQEALGMSVADILSPECWEDLRPCFALRRTGDAGRYLYEIEIVTKTGGRVALEAISSPLMRDGQITGILLVARDVSERIQLEEQLRQAQKMETIGQLAGGVAHDFNNLLTAILGYSNFVQMSLALDHPAQQDLEEVIRAAERASRLTAQLLAFSRRQVTQFRPLDLNELVLDMGRMLRRLIGEDIELMVLPEPDLGQVNADRTQIEQVLINLAVNARDAMPGGGKLTIQTANITLDTARVPASVVNGVHMLPYPPPEGMDGDSRTLALSPGDYVLLSCTDTGTGMDEEVLAHLFEPFFTTKEVGKGTGLGLATVYGIVKQHGGDIRVRSKPGRGATFEIYLPRRDQQDVEADDASATEPLPVGTETVLLVEDETSVRATTARMLRGLGYTVWEAATGDEALRLLRDNRLRVDLLLTDVVMPRMSGRELADRLAAECPECRILFTSGYTDDAILQHGVLQQQAAFLEKPFGMLELARKVRSVLDGELEDPPLRSG